MRARFALLIVLGACGTDGSSPGDDGGGGDDVTPPDAAPIEPPALTLQSPEIEFPAGQEMTYCWYFRTSNTSPLAIRRWESTVTLGARLLVFTTNRAVQMPGTVSGANCGPLAGSFDNVPAWTYAALAPDESERSLDLPADDGTGKPLAMEIGAEQYGFIQVIYANTGTTPARVRVALRGYALPTGEAFTRTATFVTYNGEISIPPGATNHTQAQTCDVPATNKFWNITSQTRRLSTGAVVKDGTPGTGRMIYESTEWRQPRVSQWDRSPFQTFTTGKLSFECTWTNTTTNTITDGNNPGSQELCMTAGYFFPATRPVLCFDEITL